MRDRAGWPARLVHIQEVVGSNPTPATKLNGCSSVVRAVVSKTARRGFESFHPCQYSLLAQW